MPALRSLIGVSFQYRHASDWANDAVPLYYELQLRFYLSVADVRLGAFSTIWGNNPDNDMAMPDIERDQAKEDMIFERLEEWIWSLRHDKPPTMAGINSKLAMGSLARIYSASDPALPTVELPRKQEKYLRRILTLNGQIADCRAEIKKYEAEIEAHSVRIAEIMKDHEHGVLETTKDRILIDFVTKQSHRTDTKKLKKDYPSVYEDVVTTSQSRSLKVSSEPI